MTTRKATATGKATATRKATARKADARGAKTHLLYRLTFGKTKG
jgi:hypothetical protein